MTSTPFSTAPDFGFNLMCEVKEKHTPKSPTSLIFLFF